MFGKTSGTSVELSTIEAGTGGFVINGVSASDESGRSISGVGDLNGDGLDDLIVGASGDDPNGSESGASFVVFGKTSGAAVELSTMTSGADGFVINGVSADDGSGASVSGAGDVNGDGFADLIVGAGTDDPNGAESGASFVLFGGRYNSATLGTNSDDTLTGTSSANQLVTGRGNDTLIGNGGADVLRGGSDNDILAVSDTTFNSLDGGAGSDTLRFDAPISLDFTSLADTKIKGIETINMSSDGGNSSVTLNLTDVLVISDTTTATNSLTINGASGDAVNLSNTSNGQNGSWSLGTNGASTDTYTYVSGSDILASVIIDDAVTVNII